MWKGHRSQSLLEISAANQNLVQPQRKELSHAKSQEFGEDGKHDNEYSAKFDERSCKLLVIRSSINCDVYYIL